MTTLQVKAVDNFGTTVFEDTADSNDGAFQKAKDIKTRYPACSIRYQNISLPGWPRFGQIRWNHLVVQSAADFR